MSPVSLTCIWKASIPTLAYYNNITACLREEEFGDLCMALSFTETKDTPKEKLFRIRSALWTRLTPHRLLLKKTEWTRKTSVLE